MKITRQIQRGFTLFEMVLALAIGSFVITAIFKIADGSVRATSKMVDIQNEDIARDAFFSMLRDHFDGLPGNARMEIRNINNSEPYQSEVTFQNTPVAFDWGGIPIAAEAMRIVTRPTLTNGLDIVVEYFDEAILDSEETTAERGIDPVATVTLLEDVRLFEWYVIRANNHDMTMSLNDWEYDWTQVNQLPTYVKLKIVFELGGPEIIRNFWIPNKQSPRTVMSALQNAARNSRNGQGGAEPEPQPDSDQTPDETIQEGGGQ